MEEALTEFFWKAVLPFLWLVGPPLAVNLAWIRGKAINFSYVAFLILGIYFAILYFQGAGWTVYVWLVIIFLFYFIDRRFSLHYDFLVYVWQKEESYKKERKQSRWKSWRETRKQEKEEEKRWEEFKQKNRSDSNNNRNRSYEEKREKTYPKDEPHDSNQKRQREEYEERQREEYEERQREESTPDPEKYYKILELNSSAKWKEVKAAYRRLVLKFHPDRNKSSDAEFQFKKIQDAFEKLKKLKKYEKERKSSFFHPPD